MNKIILLLFLISFSLFGIAQDEVPIANFSADNNEGCGSLTVQFTDLSTNAPKIWLWDFGDGTTSSEINPMHTFGPGNFEVVLKVENELGKSYKSALIKIGKIGEIFPEVNVGAGDITIGDGDYFVESDDRRLLFEVFYESILESVVVFAGSEAERTIQILDKNGIVMHSKTLTIPKGESTVPLDFRLLIDTGYAIKMSGTVDLYANTTGAGYPYLACCFNDNLLRINGSDSDKPEQYYFFYYWTLQRVPCDEVTTDVIHLEKQALRVSPNPGNGLFNIAFENYENSNGSVVISNLLGDNLYSKNWGSIAVGVQEKNVNISNLPAGYYIMSIQIGSRIYTKKIIKY